MCTPNIPHAKKRGLSLLHILYVSVEIISTINVRDTLNTINLHLRSGLALLTFYISIFTISNHWGSSQFYSVADVSPLLRSH